MSSFLVCYAMASLMISSLLIYIITKLLRTTLKYKYDVILPFAVGVVAVSSYAFFLLSGNYNQALLFITIYYVCMDWLVLTMFNFTVAYTGKLKGKRIGDVVFISLAILDSSSLLVNMRFKHSFDIMLDFMDSGAFYWITEFNKIHYVHLMLCYVMFASSIILLIVNSIKASKYYKKKYIVILAMYFFIVFLNFICFFMGSPIDISVIFYGILAFFCGHYSNHTFPSYLVNTSLVRISEGLSDVIVHFDHKGKIVFINQAAKNFFDPESGIDKDGAAAFLEKLKKKHLKELNLKNPDGSTLHYKIEFQELKQNDTIVGSYFVLEDKTDEVNQYQHEKYVATHDELTGLYNRIGFFEACEAALKQNSYEKPIMICSNLKDFKLVNEIFGETVGDEVLMRQAAMMEKNKHKTNINGRLNDDKFAILMDKIYFDEQVFIDGMIQLSKITENSSYQMDVSAGIYEIKNITESVQVMYDKAKMAMDTMENNNNGLFSVYDSTLMDKILAEKNVVNEFEGALERGEFEMYLQPVMNNEEKMKWAEALVRWNHPEQGLLYPVSFIDILERTGLLHKLDVFMCEQAAKKLDEWKKQGAEDIGISVNISSKDRYYVEFDKFLIGLTEKYDFDPKNFILEISESMLIEEFEKEQLMFEKIGNSGFKIFIDRFGSGYSSLNMLKDFKTDGIKIDAEFFIEDETSERNKIILSSMIQMAKELNMFVVAQGVETLSHVKLLNELGCNMAQGFYYSKAVPITVFEEKYL